MLNVVHSAWVATFERRRRLDTADEQGNIVATESEGIAEAVL